MVVGMRFDPLGGFRSSWGVPILATPSHCTSSLPSPRLEYLSSQISFDISFKLTLNHPISIEINSNSFFDKDLKN